MEYTFAELLKGFRKRAGINQQQLADAVRRSRNTISNWENGQTLPEDRDVVLTLGDELQLGMSEVDSLLRSSGYAPKSKGQSSVIPTITSTQITHHEAGKQPVLQPTEIISSFQLEFKLANANIILTEVKDKVELIRTWLSQELDHQVLARNCLNILAGRSVKHNIPLDVIMGKYRELQGYTAETFLNFDEYNDLKKVEVAIFMTWKERHPTYPESSFDEIAVVIP